MHIHRDRYLSELVDRMHNGMIKIVTGLRRCGKTYLLFEIFKRYLLEEGIDAENIIEVPLDDEAYSEYRDPKKLSAFIDECISGKHGICYVLLDEIQYAISDREFRSDQAPRVYGVLNGLLRRKNVDVYVTGSNSKMLSSDILTEFRGRGDEVRVRPLTFSEFMQAYDGDMYQGLSEYMLYGGMPQILSMRTDSQKTVYLERLFTETYIKDIVSRNGLRREIELEQLVEFAASSIGCLTSPKKLEATFKSELGSTMSYNTIVEYLRCLKEAFVIEEAKRFDIKGRKYINGTSKYYFEDVGLRNACLSFRQVENNHIMENVIYNELRYRGFSVDVGIVKKRSSGKANDSVNQLEADFVANLGAQRLYIQSAYSIPSKEKEDQEKRSLRSIGDSFKKIVVVHDIVKPTRDEHGILTLNIYDFLTNPDSLLL